MPPQIPAPTAPPRSTASEPRRSCPREIPATPATTRTTTQRIPRPPATTPPPSSHSRCSPYVPLFQPPYSSYATFPLPISTLHFSVSNLPFQPRQTTPPPLWLQASSSMISCL